MGGRWPTLFCSCSILSNCLRLWFLTRGCLCSYVVMSFYCFFSLLGLFSFSFSFFSLLDCTCLRLSKSIA